MKTIPLSKGKVALVDDAVYEFLNRVKWHLSSSGYAVATVHCFGTCYEIQMHRVIIMAPPGIQVDHKDSDKLNCCGNNLRFTDRAGNSQNRRLQKNNSTGYKGVYYYDYKGTCTARPWKARITIKGKLTWLGAFETREEAARAYDKAAKKFFGEFAVLNFPDE